MNKGGKSMDRKDQDEKDAENGENVKAEKGDTEAKVEEEGSAIEAQDAIELGPSKRRYVLASVRDRVANWGK
jgi:hypothetical protein